MLSRQPGCQCRWQLSHCTYHISHLISHIVGLRTFQPEIQSTMYLKVGKGSIFPYKLVIKTGSGKSPIPWAISKTDNIVIKSNSIVNPFLPRGSFNHIVTTKNKFCWYLITSHPRNRYEVRQVRTDQSVATVSRHPLGPSFNLLQAVMASCITCTGNGAIPTTVSRAAVGVVLTTPEMYRQASLWRCSSCLLTVL